jgi:hypothetical protein
MKNVEGIGLKATSASQMPAANKDNVQHWHQHLQKQNIFF